jgi:hypothetical protein
MIKMMRAHQRVVVVVFVFVLVFVLMACARSRATTMVTDCSLDCSDEGRAAVVGYRGPYTISLGGDLGDRKRCRHDHSGGGSRCDYISTNQHESARQDLNKFELCVLLHRQLERDFRAWLDCREPMIGSGLENNNDAQ